MHRALCNLNLSWLQSASSTGDLSRTTKPAATNFDFEFGESFDVNGNDRCDDFNNSDFDSPDNSGQSATSMFFHRHQRIHAVYNTQI